LRLRSCSLLLNGFEMKQSGMLQYLRSGVVILALATGLAACGGSEPTAVSDAQVVARIGQDIVTTQELDNEIRLSNVAPERYKEPEVVKKAITDLVTRKMLARRALNAKLDREPTVLLDMLRSKDVVLADAAVGRAVNGRLSALSKSDAEKYIQANPLKFEKRQALQVDQLIVPLAHLQQSSIDASKSAKSLDELAQVLSNASTPFARSAGVINTGDLTEDLSIAIRNQGLDGILFVRAGSNGAFLQVRGRESRPLIGPAAEAAARQMMRTDLTRSETSMAAFTSALEASYVGEYAKIMATK
jgi:EpsD family peptidyl-prolyl cis-trans isomerase